MAPTALARDAGWDKEALDMLRNENWNFAIFTPAKQPSNTGHIGTLTATSIADRELRRQSSRSKIARLSA